MDSLRCFLMNGRRLGARIKRQMRESLLRPVRLDCFGVSADALR
ncbi:hypothetical protein M3J09_012567 [Ascochyta lentis]